MIKRPNLLWVVVLLLGWAFDFFFWDSPAIGLNFAAYWTVCLLVILSLLLINGLKPALKSLWLIIPFFFFAGVSFVRREPLALFLAYGFSLGSLGLLAFTYMGGRWPQYSLLDYFQKFLQFVRSLIFRPHQLYRQSGKERAELMEKTQGLPIKPIVRGILIALPIVIVLTFLLTSADIVFNQKVTDFFGDFTIDKIPEYIFRLCIILILGYVFAGVFLHAAQHSSDEHLMGEDAPIVRPFLGFTEAGIVLGSVVALFLAFVLIQFRYFFGGEVNIGVEGYTYSEYARGGFNELITVAVISLFIVLGLSTITRRDGPLHKLFFSGLSVALLAEVIVILVSAYQRLSLAIDWHGFSRLRLYPRVFLIWVGILFAVVILLEAFHRERYFAFAALLASVGFAVSLGIFNVDGTIVTYNVFRAIQGKHFNVYHLTDLSTDAVPALVEAFENPLLNEDIHEGVGAAVLCYLHDDRFSTDVLDDWRSFNYSRWLAVKALDRVRDRFEDYRFLINYGDWLGARVFTPNNEIYECATQPVRFEGPPETLRNAEFEAELPGEVLTGWNITGPAEAVILETGGYSETTRLTQLGTGELVQAWQTLRGLNNGWHTLRAWVRSSGEQDLAYIALKNCGGQTRMASVPVTKGQDWMQIVVSVEVTQYECTIQLASQGDAESWVSFDNIEFSEGQTALTILGADVSSLKKSEDLGGVYADENGVPGDALEILESHGLNYVRLRVWVDSADNYHEKDELLVMAKRAKELGLKVLVDLHYSDTWADPGKQYKPEAWKDLDFDGLKQEVYTYTFGICESLAAQGTPPDMVQLGNEINDGLLWPDGKSDQWDNLAALLKKGYKAVKDCSPGIKVMLHLAEGGNNEQFVWWFDNAVERGVQFDVIGVSYYPFWHGSLADLQYNLNDIAVRYQRDVIVVETAFPFTLSGNDSLSNIIGGSSPLGYPYSPAGQAKFLGDVMTIVRAVPNGRGLGVFYWDATWTAVPGNGWNPADPKSGNGWENQALFDYENMALPAMRLFEFDPR